MATIDEILASMPDVAAEAAYEPLTIDPVTRQVIIPEAEEIFGVEGDGRAARKYFICPRYVGDNLDLATCFLEVVYRNANGEVDRYLVEDLAATEDMVAFSWELTGKVTAYKGAIQFKVHADNGAGRDWGTTLATGTSLEGLEPEAVDVETETSDLVTQLRAMVTAQTGAVEVTGAAQVEAVESAGAATTADAKAQIEAKGEAVRASIPADYTTLAGTVDRLTHDRAAAIVCDAEGAMVQIHDASADPLQGLRIFGRSTQAGEPTPDNPVDIVSLPGPVVTVCGKNLLRNDFEPGHTETVRGVTFTFNADKSIHVVGTPTASIAYNIMEKGVFPAGVYFLSGAPSTASQKFRLQVNQTVAGTEQTGGVDMVGGARFTVNNDGTALRAYIYVAADAGAVDGVFYPQLELGDAATDYEPYTGQGLTITTPDGLPGVPVTRGGNYTDATGQQWVADEVDLARGVYVQRVLTFTPATMSSVASGAKNNRAHVKLPRNGLPYSARATGLCSHFAFNTDVYSDTGDEVGFIISSETVFFRFASESDITTTELGQAWLDEQAANGAPFTVTYILAEPVETPLTTEELQAFRALHSVKPATTVLNDAGAHMVLEYAADPKTYIDNKLAALIANN